MGIPGVSFWYAVIPVPVVVQVVTNGNFSLLSSQIEAYLDSVNRVLAQIPESISSDELQRACSFPFRLRLLRFLDDPSTPFPGILYQSTSKLEFSTFAEVVQTAPPIRKNTTLNIWVVQLDSTVATDMGGLVEPISREISPDGSGIVLDYRHIVSGNVHALLDLLFRWLEIPSPFPEVCPPPERLDSPGCVLEGLCDVAFAIAGDSLSCDTDAVSLFPCDGGRPLPVMNRMHPGWRQQKWSASCSDLPAGVLSCQQVAYAFTHLLIYKPALFSEPGWRNPNVLWDLTVERVRVVPESLRVDVVIRGVSTLCNLTVDSVEIRWKISSYFPTDTVISGSFQQIGSPLLTTCYKDLDTLRISWTPGGFPTGYATVDLWVKAFISYPDADSLNQHLRISAFWGDVQNLTPWPDAWVYQPSPGAPIFWLFPAGLSSIPFPTLWREWNPLPVVPLVPASDTSFQFAWLFPGYFLSAGTEWMEYTFPVRIPPGTPVWLQMDIAYAWFDMYFVDTLEIWVEEVRQGPLPVRWMVAHLSGDTLRSLYPRRTIPWKPVHPQEWKTWCVYLPAVSGKTIRLLFRFRSGYGNHMYLTRVGITSLPACRESVPLGISSPEFLSPLSSRSRFPHLILLDGRRTDRLSSPAIHIPDRKMFFSPPGSIPP